MKLHELRIEGFRKHLDTSINFSDSTFLIGENNAGKSSVLHALKYLLELHSSIPEEEYYAINHSGKQKVIVDEIVLTAEFRDIPLEAKKWRGFKGRLLPYEVDESETSDSGLKFIYRKTFPKGEKVKVETLEHPKSLKEGFEGYRTIQDLLDAGLEEDELDEEVKKIDYDKVLVKKEKDIVENIDALFDFDESQEQWIVNPGGIAPNVSSKLPKLLLIPAQDREDEISGKVGTLQLTLNELFSEVRDNSKNYKKAQEYLNKLAEELDVKNEKTELSQMLKELNDIISEVFPHTGINAVANLNDADNVIKPIFNIQMNSNVTTTSKLQGTGLVRSTVFALLRYKALRDNRRESSTDRHLIIGFEEPEIYLHPNAISKMRDTIYSLAETGKNQIICTTHSPFMIDISKKPNQILNTLFEYSIEEDEKKIIKVECTPFNVTKEFLELLDNDKSYIKMLLRVEDSISKCFFVKNVLVVEGDTEKIVLEEAISKLPKEIKSHVQADWYILRARGKAAIISIIKYLKAMNINVFVMHDKDENKDGAKKFNEPIRNALGNDEKLVVLENCIEDVLGYQAPSFDKPYKAYEYTNKNWEDWNSIPQNWKDIMAQIFNQGTTI